MKYQVSFGPLHKYVAAAAVHSKMVILFLLLVQCV